MTDKRIGPRPENFHTIRCAECGDEFETFALNAKYCSIECGRKFDGSPFNRHRYHEQKKKLDAIFKAKQPLGKPLRGR